MSVKNKSKNYFSSVDPKVSFPDMESNILNFWEKILSIKNQLKRLNMDLFLTFMKDHQPLTASHEFIM